MGLVSDLTTSHYDLQFKISFFASYIPKTWRMEGMKVSCISYMDDLWVFKEVLLDIWASCPWRMTLLLYLISSSHQGVPNNICYILNRRIISAPFPLLHHMSSQQINHAKVITTCFKMKQAQGTFFKLTSGPIVREEVYQVVFFFFFFDKSWCPTHLGEPSRVIWSICRAAFASETDKRAVLTQRAFKTI